MADRPLVSIVTPAWNAERYLAATLASVAAQGWQDWEHLVVDDASTDATPDLIATAAAREPRIRPLRLGANGGAAVARNAAIRAARGRFIAFLDADDEWVPEKLETQLGYMRATGAAFTYAGWWRVDAEGREIGAVDVPPRATYRALLKANHVGCLTAVYDTAALGKVEMPLIRKRQDLGLWLKILRQIPEAHGLAQRLGRYRVRRDSVSADKIDAARHTWALYREVEGLSRPVAAYYFAHYATNALVRRVRR